MTNRDAITVTDFRANLSDHMRSASGGEPVSVGDNVLVSGIAFRALKMKSRIIGQALAHGGDQAVGSLAYPVVGLLRSGDTLRAAEVVVDYHSEHAKLGGDKSIEEVVDDVLRKAGHVSLGEHYLSDGDDMEVRKDDLLRTIRIHFPSLANGGQPMHERDLPTPVASPKHAEFGKDGLRPMLSVVDYTDGIIWEPQSLAACVGSQIGLQESPSGAIYDENGDKLASSKTFLAEQMVELGWIEPGRHDANQLHGEKFRDSGSLDMLRRFRRVMIRD